MERGKIVSLLTGAVSVLVGIWVTVVAYDVLPPCSDIAGVENPVYCLGGLTGPEKGLLILFGVAVGVFLSIRYVREKINRR